MGEVYRARDTRLDRAVAIKILPAELSQSSQFKLRFEREAKTISQLNHPHICTLYDVGENYLVMELLDGETLAERLAHGPLPIEDVLRYGIQIAEALDKAHRQDVVHRDLKPSNIMLTKSGAKLLDFGLAKSGAAGFSPPGSATQHKPLTSEGTIVGTFQYMAPEQLEGEEADARTDIFAFGEVLYEMATGKRAFEGKTRTSLIAAIVSGEPAPLSRVRPVAPAALETIIRRCLAKEPDARWQCAADLKWELLGVPQEPATSGPARISRLPWIVTAAALIAAAVLAVMLFRPNAPNRPIRFSVTAPHGWTYAVNYNLGPPAVSPDGRYMAFAATDEGGARVVLWLRDFSASEAIALPGTDGAGYPFWSPDSKSIAFFGGDYLKRIDIAGGSPQLLCPAAFGRGGSWSVNDVIIFSPGGSSPLYQISANGGTARQLTHLDASQRDVSHRLPCFLPDGKHFIFLIRRPSVGEILGESLNVASLDSPVPRHLIDASSNVDFVDPGYLLFLRNQRLVKQRFNVRTLQLEGEAAPAIGDTVSYHASGFGAFSASRSGVLAFASGSQKSSLEWIDRNGRMETAIATPTAYTTPRLTHDQKAILYAVPDAVTGTLDLWLYDVARAIPRRVTFHPRDEFGGVPTPDGANVIFASNRLGFPSLFIKALDGSDEKEVMPPSGNPDFPEDISQDGRVLLFRRISGQTQNDLFTLPLGAKTPSPFIATPFNEIQPKFSPSGHWIAYVSNESGSYQVYAARYPGGGSRVQITAGGGTQPTWRADERELFYLGTGGRMMAVPIDTSSGTLKVGTAAHLFDVVLRPARDEEREYDVTRDGKGFIMNTVPPDKHSIPITVVLNWQLQLPQK
jgi:eukaryotic-like serine/threonine-protein kinase